MVPSPKSKLVFKASLNGSFYKSYQAAGLITVVSQLKESSAHYKYYLLYPDVTTLSYKFYQLQHVMLSSSNPVDLSSQSLTFPFY